MKKLTNKGFTLVELLAVVVILLAITVVAIPSISSAIERNKEKRNKTQYDIIESYAEIYYENHLNKYTSKENFCININDLDLSPEEKKDANGKQITGKVIYDNDSKEFKYSKDTNCPQ